MEGIAQQYNVSQDTLMQLNSLSGPEALIAGDVIDVPLKGSVFSNLLSSFTFTISIFFLPLWKLNIH